MILSMNRIFTIHSISNIFCVNWNIRKYILFFVSCKSSNKFSGMNFSVCILVYFFLYRSCLYNMLC